MRGAGATFVALAVPFVALFGAACTAPPAPINELATSKPKQTKPPPPETTKPPEIKKGDAGAAGETCETVAPNNKCGLDPQCGCLETETCDVTNNTNGSTSCVTGGTTTLGRPCVATGDCMAGLGCIYGACRPYCKTALTKCAVGGTDLCVQMNDEQGKPFHENLTFCTLSCDPREPSGVCGTNSCHWFESLYAPNKVSDCNFAGAADAQEICKSDSECKPGLACVSHPKYGLECERWCRLGVAGDCGTNPKFTCKDVFADKAPVINGVKEGICQDD